MQKYDMPVALRDMLAAMEGFPPSEAVEAVIDLYRHMCAGGYPSRAMTAKAWVVVMAAREVAHKRPARDGTDGLIREANRAVWEATHRALVAVHGPEWATRPDFEADFLVMSSMHCRGLSNDAVAKTDRAFKVACRDRDRARDGLAFEAAWARRALDKLIGAGKP